MTREQRQQPMELWTFFEDDPLGVEESVLRNNPQQGLWGYAASVRCRQGLIRPLKSQIPLRPDQMVIVPPEGENLEGWTESSPWFSAQSMSSVRPTSYWYLALQRFCLPVRECIRSRMARFPSYKQIRLRQRRLYKSDIFYWRIFWYNCIFRFCWMLSSIPAYHLSTSGRDVVTTFSSDTHSYVGVLLPMAEIFRRTIWGFLHVEIQTLRMSEGNPAYNYTPVVAQTQDEEELSSSDSRNSKNASRNFLPAWLLGSQQPLQHEAATSSSSFKLSNIFALDDATREKLFFAELCVWAVGFVVAGMWACT